MSSPDNSLQIRRSARGRLLALGLLAATCLAAAGFSARPELSEVPTPGSNDIALYRAEIEQIRGGEGYYAAALQELTARGYPTRSVFNWRTPLPMWLIGHLPDGLGQLLLVCLGMLLLGMAYEATARDSAIDPGTGVPGRWRNSLLPMLTTMLLTGPLLFVILGDLYVMPIFWAGIFLTLSLCAYGVNRPILGVTFGLAAVFFRELALPYALLAATIAAGNRRRRELVYWALGLLAWGTFFGLHAWRVGTLIPADARAHAQGWFQCGGLYFIFDLVQINAYLINLPRWATALYFVAAMGGFAHWNTSLGRRMTFGICAFLIFFGLVGQEFNRYWGALIAPLLCFGAARFPFALRDLWQAAWSKTVFQELLSPCRQQQP